MRWNILSSNIGHVIHHSDFLKNIVYMVTVSTQSIALQGNQLILEILGV